MWEISKKNPMKSAFFFITLAFTLSVAKWTDNFDEIKKESKLMMVELRSVADKYDVMKDKSLMTQYFQVGLMLFRSDVLRLMKNNKEIPSEIKEAKIQETTTAIEKVETTLNKKLKEFLAKEADLKDLKKTIVLSAVNFNKDMIEVYYGNLDDMFRNLFGH